MPAGELSDLVPDSALANASADELGLDAVAGVVVDLAGSVATPATIAVFGAWGSGKTSLGNLVRERSKATSGPRIRYAYFNAWKYAETPLRRYFLTKAAEALGEDAGYAKKLYGSTKRTHYRITNQTAKAVLGIGVALATSYLALVALAQFVAWLPTDHSSDYWQRLYESIADNAGALLVSTALLTPVLTFLLNQMRVDENETEPSSDEQFDDLFASLIKKRVGADEVALFYVDELDRAPSTHMQGVLETFKTFLDHPRCVFVVAADQVVLEEAVARSSDLAAPSRANAYYSSGSGYLDKIFQYQIHLPAFESPVLTRYALSLADRLGGVWKSLDGQREVVISVLVPTHVRSPRRVKVLLNAFVLSVRAAKGRVEEEFDHVQFLQLAKLTCLRTEFPLFFRDLEEFPRLADLVTAMIMEDNDRIAEYSTTPQFVSVAKGYAVGSAPVDIELASKDTSAGSGRNDLIDYLRRTREVTIRDASLLYLRPLGADVGIGLELARPLETAARNGSIADALALLSGRAATDRRNAILYLAHILDDAIGVEIENVAATLVNVASENADAIDDATAGEIVRAVSRTPVWNRLDPSMTEGLVTVSARLETSSRQPFEEALLRRAEEGEQWGRALIAAHPHFGDSGRATCSELIASYLRSQPEVAVSGLVGMSPEEVGEAIGGAPTREIVQYLAGEDLPPPPVTDFATQILPTLDSKSRWNVVRPILADGNQGVIERNSQLLASLEPAADGEDGGAVLAGITESPANLNDLLELLPTRRVPVDEGLLLGALAACVNSAASSTSSLQSLERFVPSLHTSLNVAAMEDGLEDWSDGSWNSDPTDRSRQHQLLMELAAKAPKVSFGFVDLVVSSLIGMIELPAASEPARTELESRLGQIRVGLLPSTAAHAALFDALAAPRTANAADALREPYGRHTLALAGRSIPAPTDAQLSTIRSHLATANIKRNTWSSSAISIYIETAKPRFEATRS